MHRLKSFRERNFPANQSHEAHTNYRCGKYCGMQYHRHRWTGGEKLKDFHDPSIHPIGPCEEHGDSQDF